MYSISVNINGTSYKKNIPQEWNDLQWIDYVNAKTKEKQNESNINAILSALTGIPEDALDAMHDFDHRFILTQCSFYWNETIPKNALPADFVETQIATDTWQKLIDSEQEFKRINVESLPEVAAAQFIINTYTGVDIKGMKVPDAAAYWDFFFSNSLSGESVGVTCTNQKQTTMKLRQELKRYRRLSGLRQFTLLRREMSRSMTPFSIKKLMSFTQPYYLRKRKTSTGRTSRSTMNL